MARKKGNNGVGTFGQPINKNDAGQMLQARFDDAASNMSDVLSQAKGNGVDYKAWFDNLDKATRDQFDVQIHSNAQEITLPLGENFEAIKFHLVIIPWQEIESRTRIHKANARLEKYFKEFDKLKAQEMLRFFDPMTQTETYANTTPVLASTSKDSMINVFDGLRRRFGCIKAQCDLKAYVTDQELTHFHASLASRKNNDHVVNGFLDRRSACLKERDRIIVQREEKGQEPLSKNKMALELNMNKSDYFLFDDSVNLPDSIFMAFPSPTTIGRNVVRKLVKAIVKDGTDKAIVDKGIESMRAAEENIDEQMSSEMANSHCLAVFLKSIENSRASSGSGSSKPEPYVLPNGAGTVTISEKGVAKCKLDALTTENVEHLYTQLKALVEDAKS